MLDEITRAVLAREEVARYLEGSHGETARAARERIQTYLEELRTTQRYSIYKALKLEAETAAQLAVDLLNGKTLTGESADTDGVPTTLLNPVVVTIDNIMDTVIADGFYKVEDICTAEYADACAAAGIK